MLFPIPTTTNSYNYIFIRFMLDYAPLLAIVVEFGLPLLLIIWRYTTYKYTNSMLYKILIIIAALFHLMICLPLPPLSAYPFRLVLGQIYMCVIRYIVMYKCSCNMCGIKYEYNEGIYTCIHI